MDCINLDEEVEVYLKPVDIQNHLKISRSKTYELLNETDFPKVKLGCSFRVPLSGYKKWLENKKREVLK